MIYIDLDNTLIDSVGRLENEKQVAARFGISERDYDWAVRQTGVNFSYEKLYQTCRLVTRGLSPDVITEWEETLQKPRLFSDTKPFLARFPKEKLILITSTSGTPKLQQTKIEANGLSD